MKKPTPAQLRFLKRIADHNGYLPAMKADMRTHAPLLHRGLIALAYANGDDWRDGYVFTPAGKALHDATHSHKGDG